LFIISEPESPEEAKKAAILKAAEEYEKTQEGGGIEDLITAFKSPTPDCIFVDYKKKAPNSIHKKDHT